MKAVARKSYKIDLSDTDDIIKKISDDILPKYTEIFQLFLSNLRKLFLHYINYIENQYKYLQILKIIMESKFMNQV